MRKFRDIASIVVICFLAVVLLASSTQARPASVLLQEGLYAEEIEGDLDAAIRIYEQIAADKSADGRYAAQAMYRLGLCYQKKQDYQQAKATFEKLIARFPKEKSIIEKVQPLLDQMSTQDPAALMPAETLVYLEFGSPGKQIETILNMLKGTPFENPLAHISARGGPGVGIGPAGALASLLNPSMITEFKKIRGVALGFQAIHRNNPPLVAVIYPGESDALRGIIIAGLGMVLQAGEPIAGMQTLRMDVQGGAAYDDNVIILASPIDRLTWCVKQYKGITNEPTLASQNKAFQKLSRKQREQNAVTIWADVDKVFPIIKEEMLDDHQRALIESIGDIGNVDEFTTSLSLEKDGLAVETNIGFKDGHSCLAYDLIRTPNITRAGFEAVPAEAVALVSFALGEAEGTGAASARKAVKKLTGLDIGRELFANIEQITLFALPPTPTSTKNVLAESISPVVPCLGLAVTSHNPKRTEQLVTRLLTLTDLVMGISKGEELVERRQRAVGQYRIGEFNRKPAYCYVGQAGKSTVLTLSPEVLQASLSAVKSKTSASSAGPLHEVLSRLLPGTSKLVAVNAAGAIQLANVHICGSDGVSPDPRKNYFSQLLGELAQACDETYAVVRTDEKANNFALKTSISGIPELGQIFPIVAQIPGAMENPILVATGPRPADKAMIRPAAAVELNWEPGRDATAHKVYFGSSIDNLSLLGEVKRPGYDKLPAPERGVDYYWRVDEVRADGSVITGDIWQFSLGKLVAWWKLDNDAKDSSGNNHHGTVKGDPKWVTGKIGGALEFDGEGDYVDLAIAGPLGNSPRTVCAWAKTKSNSGQYILSYGEHSNRAGATFRAGLSAWGGCEGVTVDVSYGAVTYAARVADGSWHHYSFVVPDKEDVRVGDVRVYQDGRLLTDTCGPHNLDQVLDTKAANPINIGRHIEGTHYFNGVIDEVMVFNYALSEEEILELCATTVATLPQPANRSVVKPGADVKLGWKPGKDATAHKVYFGTNTDKLSVLAEVKTPSYPKLPRVQKGITYYWRVDEVQADGSVVTGDIWSFSTGKLVAWWKFDETSGKTAKDSSGNNYHGTAVHGDPIWKADGKFGGCLDFNERYGISIPKDVFDGIDRAITISVWVYGNQRQKKHSDVILQAGAGDAGKPYIVSIYTDWLDYGLKFATGIGEPDRLEFNPGAPEDWTGRWNHYAFVKDADKGFKRIYMNGSLVAEKTGAMASMSGVGAARIGIAPDRFGDQHIGRLDDFRIYNYALSSEEIQELCGVVPGFGPVVESVEPRPPASPAPSYIKGLVGHWKFDEGRGTKAYDSKGNNHGTIHGAQWTGGRVNGALYFDSREDYVSISPVTLSKNWTVSAWCEPLRNEVGGCNPIMGGPEDYDNYIILCEAKHHINLETDTDGDWVIVCKGAVDFNEWAYYTVTRNGNTISAYRNGVHIDDATLPKGGKNTITKIGSGYGAATYYKGRIDDVRIYNMALSAEEIRELYTKVSGFGPVIERVVYHGGSDYECLIDFETGKLYKVPEHLKGGENEEQALQWIEQTGVDAAGDTEGPMESQGLKGFPDDMAALPVPGGWDASPSLLVPSMRVFSPSGKARMFAKGDLPATYWFKTGEGNMGVLQILGFAEGKPRGVRIRYKMVQAEAGVGIMGIRLQKPAYEWWRVKPRVTYHIYEDTQLEVKWEVALDSKTAKRIRAFAVGVLPIKEDISDLPAHYYWEDNLAFTVRRTPYGKEWGRSTSSKVSPKTLRPGEYRVYVCAYYRYRYGVSWSDRLTDVIGAGTAKLIVKPRPQAPALVPGFGPAKPLPVDELIKSGRVPAFRTVLHGNSALDLETGAVVSLPVVERTRAEVSVRPGAMIGAAVAVKTQAQWPEGFDVAWSYEGGEALVVRPDSEVRIVAIPGAEKERWDQAISLARGALTILRTSTADKVFANQTNFAAVLTSEGNLATVQIGEYSQQKATLYWWIERPMAKRPVPTGYCKIFLPEAESAVNDLLDLASGTLQNSDAMRRDVAYFERLGRGDIAFDETNGQDWLFCFRGARMQRRLGDGLTSSEPERVEGAGFIYLYQVREVPCDFVVTTAEGHRYELKVLSRERGDRLGVNIEYWKSAEAATGFTGTVEVLHPDSAVKLSRLGQAVAVYAADHNGKLPGTLQELKPYIGDFQWLIENVKYVGKGQESQQPDTPIAYDKTLLEKGNGTNILFLDGHVEFRQAEELTSVKRTIEHR